mmetsp:Transcript_1448/g.2205  ORF Transcript_1448/g.2205 Transcript_1448/m.2205 type:complete len:128 (+) Transcript_1448:104-487(+)|eukprot:CAMPEP_0197233586 /NCGR_PEP_ID=MMETSP1429-20130617/1607_1 /TAXON_ID=49237 /ORGANISM="Chaetoceros  sp., Strain UNC1202" /LENGTH=127 /DNA_ID=CAMNT_0042691851 /DNA_START=57 /DNA_END=440 /DNA_ORIENTATION=-
MKSFFTIFFVLAIAASVVNGFSAGAINGGSSFASAQRVTVVTSKTVSTKGDMQMMGGKKSKFGIFSPAVYAAKLALGEKKLNKIRGKGISLHSQTIGEFTQWVGAYHLRTKLIKTAKQNGDILGFLV